MSKTRDKKSSGQTREAQVHRLALSRSNQLGKGKMGDGALLTARYCRCGCEEGTRVREGASMNVQ